MLNVVIDGLFLMWVAGSTWYVCQCAMMWEQCPMGAVPTISPGQDLYDDDSRGDPERNGILRLDGMRESEIVNTY